MINFFKVKPSDFKVVAKIGKVLKSKLIRFWWLHYDP